MGLLPFFTVYFFYLIRVQFTFQDQFSIIIASALPCTLAACALARAATPANYRPRSQLLISMALFQGQKGSQRPSQLVRGWCACEYVLYVL